MDVQWNKSDVHEGPVSIDTTFVMFFLALDLGQSVAHAGLDTIFSAVTLAMVVVLPYFMRAKEFRPDLGKWLVQRLTITLFAAFLGVIFHQALGPVFPESFRYLPLTLLLIAAVVGTYVQFAHVYRFRLAK